MGIKHPRIDDPLGARSDLICGECGNLMVLRYTEIYERYFYGCTKFPSCSGTHGAHADGTPLGTPANKETKRARQAAHEYFDRLWHTACVPRKVAYRWLGQELGIPIAECHIGCFTLEQCARVVEICSKTRPVQLHAAWKEGRINRERRGE